MAINGIDAIWIATAALSTKAIIGKINMFKLEDVCFEAEEILNIAKKITKEKIDISTVLQDATANAENSKSNYLVDENGLRRVSFMGEFVGKKECPDISVIREGDNYNKILDIADLDMKEIYEFMNRGYTERFKNEFEVKIDKKKKRKKSRLNRRTLREWIIPCNPTKYDIFNAFTKLKKINWKQTANIEVGDIIYIYISQGYHLLKYKCQVNKVDLEVPEIDDSKFDITGEFDGTYGRYMEIELIKELNGDLYSKEAMEKHGFSSPQNQIRLNPELKRYLILVQNIQAMEEIDPYEHDGSYEIVKEIINSYASMGDLSKVDYRDLNLLYVMTIGTWKQKIDSKKRNILDSNLTQYEKDMIIEIVDEVWDRAERFEYQNEVYENPSIGMFGTGFFSFKNKADAESSRNFIQMCVDINDMEDDYKILERCDEVLTDDFNGMKAASASMILHCLKPMTFPIFNSNMGNKNIFEYLGLEMKKKTDLSSYIENTRKVKALRDNNFTVKNYRIFDIIAQNIDLYNDTINITENKMENSMVKDKNEIEYDKNMILYGPPGTGKTYNTAIYAVAICDNKKIEDVESLPYDKVLERYNELKTQEGRIAFTTFHQSYGYEEFIEGIKPKVDDNSTDIEYTIKDGIFKEFCNRAEKDGSSNSASANKGKVKPYVFIIDEINRGNISKIFGELITLIESSKRKGTLEAMEAILPYSNSQFGVPENVYIIGTMNTADRSIALMDTALRRRFQFIEKMPDSEVLRKIGADKIRVNDEELDVANMLECINKRIEYLFDREHTIGHAFFTCLKDEPTISKLASIFKKSVIPLLQEYFYEDYSKIMLILGDNGKKLDAHKFILEKEINANNIFRGDTSDIDIPDYSYQIQESAFEDIMSYIGIIE